MAGIDFNTNLMLHFNGTDGDTSTTDSSFQNHSITFAGTAQLKERVGKFDASALFNGVDTYLTAPDSTDWDLIASSSENWTVDFWVSHNSLGSEEWYLSQFADANNLFGFFKLTNDRLFFQVVDSGPAVVEVSSTPNAITDANFHHIAMCKVGSDYGLYLDGIQIGYDSSTSTVTFASLLYIGQKGNNSRYFNGNMDELRIQKSNPFTASPNVGLTDTITVPTSAYTADSNTKLLLHYDSDFTDSGTTGHTITNNNNTIINLPKFGSSSLQLDGDSDYITIADSTDWDLVAANTDNWTIDFWIRFDQFVGSQWSIAHGIGSERWELLHQSGAGWEFQVIEGGFQKFASNISGVITDSNWHHVALIKIASKYGVYVDGSQINYVQNTSTVNTAGLLYMGVNPPLTNFLNGNLDELRVQNSNYFNALPNVGVTDTITVPTIEYNLGTLPNAPTNLIATAISSTQIGLSWDAASIPSGGSAIIGYQIRRESPIGNGFFIIVPDTGNTNTTYTDTGLIASTQYNYTISAITADGIGDASSPDDATTTAEAIDDEIRFNKFFGRHEHIKNTSAILNFDKFSGKHFKNYDVI